MIEDLKIGDIVYDKNDITQFGKIHKITIEVDVYSYFVHFTRTNYGIFTRTDILTPKEYNSIIRIKKLKRILDNEE